MEQRLSPVDGRVELQVLQQRVVPVWTRAKRRAVPVQRLLQRVGRGVLRRLPAGERSGDQHFDRLGAVGGRVFNQPALQQKGRVREAVNQPL